MKKFVIYVTYIRSFKLTCLIKNKTGNKKAKAVDSFKNKNKKIFVRNKRK